MVSFEKSHGRTRSRHGAPQLIPDARQDAKERPGGWEIPLKNAGKLVDSMGNSAGKTWETGGLMGKVLRLPEATANQTR
jgi:hypothetical protein